MLNETYQKMDCVRLFDQCVLEVFHRFKRSWRRGSSL